MKNLCTKCRNAIADVPEPCCGAPDCEDTIYLVCSACDNEQYEEDMNFYYEWLANQEGNY